ncbi:MAG TPA: metal-dependent transcriptional regulator [Vicinamibacterales bacterium]|nr:metal-dependent transcriptional regulator [Vicinamibacterales bacterium]
MLPSQTVENYLKTIYLAQLALPSTTEDEDALVPMGQISATLGVVPGTATTMIKTLAESGLVHYEPYLGVRLTAAGERLAGLVIRRHRLVELFLVKVLGMSWAEVHDEAERLEHAVSERLIDRIDEMLGRPVVDPHGDPIPTPEGRLPYVESVELGQAPEQVPLVVIRVTDQDPEFLRFVELRDLIPGRSVQVVGRDAAAETLQIQAEDGGRATIGLRAASKILVRAA